MWLKLVDVILLFQPALAVLIFFSILLGKPPLWLSWLIAVIPWGLRLWRTGRLTKRTPFDLPILLFTVGMVIGFAVAPDQVVAQQGLHTYLACILLYYGIVNNGDAKISYQLSIVGVGVVCLISLGLTIFVFSQGWGRHYFFNEWVYQLAQALPKLDLPRIDEGQIGYNVPGAALALLLPLLLSLTLFQQRLCQRLTWGILCFSFSALLFFVGSGGGWLSAAIGLIFVLLCWKLWTLALTLPATGAGIWAIISSWDKASPLSQTWLAEMFPFGSVAGRMHSWENTLNLLKDHPFTGGGLGAWFELYAAAYGSPSPVTPYNTYLQIYADTGLLGGVAIICAVIAFGYILRHILHSSAQSNWYGIAIGAMGCILAGAINGLFELNTSAYVVEGGTVLYYVALPYLWLWAGLVVVAYHRLRQQPVLA
jgi:O-antigen ligase